MPGRGALIIAKQELKAFLDRPAGYVLLAVFAFLVDFLFFRAAFASGEASLRPMLSMIPWVWLVFVPAVTMRLLAEEERTGTLEMLLTQPVKEIDVLVGKFLGGWGVVLLALATTLPVPISLATAARMDWGIVLSQYLAGALLAAAMVAIGLFASSLTRNQVMASITAATIGFGLILLGNEIITLAAPRSVGEALTQLSLLSHTENMARGVVDLRDLVYFLSVVFVFGLGAYLVFKGKRANRRTEHWYNLEVGAALLVGIAVALNMLLAPFGARLDLTASRLYTLSPAAVKLVRESPEDITITLFASRDLPPQVATTYRDVRDVLRDFAQASGGRVQLLEKYPDVDEDARQAGEALGIQAVQFNVMEQARFQASQGWLGVALQTGSKREAIPFVQKTDDLEYQLASLIRKMRGGAKATIAFSSGHNEKTADQLSLIRGELAKSYTVKDVSPDKTGLPLTGVKVLVVVGPQTPFSVKEREGLSKFLDGGGKALFLLEGYTVNPQFMLATPNPASLGDFTAKYGARVDAKLLLDVASHEVVTFSGGQQPISVSYPFWPRVAAKAANVTGDVDSVVLPWASPVTAPTTDVPKGAEVTPLLSTSPQAAAESGQPSIAFDRDYGQGLPKLSTYLAGAAVQGPAPKDAAKADQRWRVVVIGDADFAADDTVRQAPEGGVLILNSIDWLAQDEALAGIRAKTGAQRQLRFDSFVQQLIVAWGNQFGIPVLIIVIGTWHLLQRRRRARKGDAR